MLLTLDASIWINAYSPQEPGHFNSLALIDKVRLDSVTLVQPTLFPVEIAGAIARTRDPILARAVTDALLALPSIRWVALDDVIARQALALAAEHRLRGADAVYAAVAKTQGCTLVSLDNEHLTRLTAVVPTLAPGDALARMASP